MLKYPCLVLDHDDTVVRSEQTVNYPCFCEFFKIYRPGASLSLEEYIKGCFCPGFVALCKDRFAMTAEELQQEYRFWQQYVRTHIPEVFPGMEAIIRTQRELGGRICVVSHSAEENIRRDYQVHFGIQPDEIYGCDLPEHQQKPNTYPLEAIMEKYGFHPQELLMVDDLKPGWVMAQRAGIRMGFALWSKQDVPEIAEEMTKCADFTFKTPEALYDFLF